MSATTTASQTQTQPTPERSLESRFGQGKYFSIQCEVFKDCKRVFQFTEEVSEKVAKSIATELGSIFSKGQVTLKGFDKTNKDGGLKTISEVVKVKGLPISDPVAMLRALNYCKDAGKFLVQAVWKSDYLETWAKSL